jgi:17beta-estradiol 17-dehydrogenase / very-long-chain 3-oxoacyl-CoA reductase
MFLKGIGFLSLGMFFSYPSYIFYRDWFIEIPNFPLSYGNKSFALVTGGTNGIGKAFCDLLASQGLNLIIVSRDQEKLSQTAEELKTKYEVEVRTHKIDFSKATKEDYDKLKEKTEGLDISTLISNGSPTSDSFFVEMSYDEIEEFIRLNNTSLTSILRLYLPQLSKRKQKSAVITVSSMSGSVPTPYMELTSACKAYDIFMTRSLSKRYEKSINFLSLEPGLIDTGDHQGQSPRFTCSPEQAVKSALKDLGHRPVSFGHYTQELLFWAMHWMPGHYRVQYLLNYIQNSPESKTSSEIE